MTTLTQLIKEREEKFDELWDWAGCSECGGIEADMRKIEAFNQETIKLILEKVREMVREKKRWESFRGERDLSQREIWQEAAWNDALEDLDDDLSSHLQEVIKELSTR